MSLPWTARNSDPIFSGMKLKIAFGIVSVLLVLSLTVLSALLYHMYDVQRSVTATRALLGAEPWRAAIGRFVPLATPRPAPEFSFAARSGAMVNLADYRGHVVLVNLWATWCGPCIKEMPSLAHLQADLRELKVLAISEDERGAELVDPFLTRLSVPGLAIFLDPKKQASHAFHIEGLPSSFLIDREGQLVGGLEGASEWDSPVMLDLLREYLHAPPKAAANAG